MDIHTSLARALLYANIAIFAAMTQRVSPHLRRASLGIFLRTSFLKIFNILYLLYFMVFVMFVDAAYNLLPGSRIKSFSVLNGDSDRIDALRYERNLYLSAFVLAIVGVNEVVARIVSRGSKAEELNAYRSKEHGNASEFIGKVMKDLNKEKEKNKEIETRASALEEENSSLKNELENNKKVYLRLKDKYERISGDSYKKK
ncbi:hypothetical protein ENBRE01_3232 [Enteropsectra breve]|nr:hypothetical protein ENBRE01_3232 [Enteropsectra breve]